MEALLVSLSLDKHPNLSSILGDNVSDAADDLVEVLGATFTLKDGQVFELFYWLAIIHFDITWNSSSSVKGIYCSVSSATVCCCKDIIGAGIPL